MITLELREGRQVLGARTRVCSVTPSLVQIGLLGKSEHAWQALVVGSLKRPALQTECTGRGLSTSIPSRRSSKTKRPSDGAFSLIM